MSERFREFFRGAFRSKVEKVRTELGETTAESIASQLEGSKPVDFNALLGEKPTDSQPAQLNKYGEIVDEDKTKS